MIHDGFIYLGTLMLLAAILVNLPVYLKGKGAQKFFKFAPPIVLLYLGMMLLCTMKMWNLEDTAATYKAVKNPLLYAMLFLMLLRCDLKKSTCVAGSRLPDPSDPCSCYGHSCKGDQNGYLYLCRCIFSKRWWNCYCTCTCRRIQ